MIRNFSRIRPRGVATLAATMLALAAVQSASSCAGKGVLYTAIDAPVQGSCAKCHDAAQFDGLLDAIRAADDARFTAERFPDAQFPPGLVAKTTQDLIAAATPAEDALLDPSIPKQKAWVLHELHELRALLSEATPPDFTSQASFDAFATFGEAPAYEGCEVGDKLDLGFAAEPEGMPPLWGKALFEILGRELEELSPANRQTIKDYVDGLLPGGLDACTPGGGGSAS